MKISKDEIQQFNYIPKETVVDCMELYLIYGYNMQQVQEQVFGDTSGSAHRVSLIHRCYNFSNRNGGRYGRDGAFTRTYGREVTRSDIEAFVYTYPGGTYDIGITFDEFLLGGGSPAENIYGENDENFFEDEEGSFGEYPGVGTGYSGRRSGSRKSRREPMWETQSRGGFRLSDYWTLAGFTKLKWELITLAISTIPCVIVMADTFFHSEATHNALNAYMTLLTSTNVKIALFWTWGVPAILFILNGGFRIIGAIIDAVDKLPQKLHLLAYLFLIPTAIFMGLFCAECIPVFIYVMVRLIRGEYRRNE